MEKAVTPEKRKSKRASSKELPEKEKKKWKTKDKKKKKHLTPHKEENSKRGRKPAEKRLAKLRKKKKKDGKKESKDDEIHNIAANPEEEKTYNMREEEGMLVVEIERHAGIPSAGEEFKPIVVEVPKIPPQEIVKAPKIQKMKRIGKRGRPEGKIEKDMPSNIKPVPEVSMGVENSSEKNAKPVTELERRQVLKNIRA